MRLSRFYSKVLEYGKDKDPRNKKSAIKSYSDTAILNGDLSLDVKKLLVGIDIDVSELLLADRLREKDGLDLVLSHHPSGSAYAGLPSVMQLQVDLLRRVGICESAAKNLVDDRQQEVIRRILPSNHTRTVDAAKVLGIAFMCVHTPADNHASSFVEGLLKRSKPRRLCDIVDILLSVPEYKYAASVLAGPRIILGNPNRKVGKVFVEMTGGTEGPRDVYEKLYKAGVRTLVSMHLSEEHFKKVTDADLNVVVAGHISSDTLGLNLLLDRIEKDEKFLITSCSGFSRIRR